MTYLQHHHQSADTSIEQYYAAVVRLNLKPTNVPGVFLCMDDRMHYNVPDPSKFTPKERARIIERLTERIKGY